MLPLGCPPGRGTTSREPPPVHSPTNSIARSPTMNIHQHHAGDLDLESTPTDPEDTMGGTTPPSSSNKWGLPFILNTPTFSPDPAQKCLVQDEKKRRRMCKVAGCTKYIVQMGRCCRHGGGKKCLVDGCFTGAKHRGLCWKHGGCTECTVDGCSKKAKARGLCWSHGGGTRCQHPGCAKVTISKGFCWAHGGGKRCLVSDCIKPAFERTHNFCQKHYKQLPRDARAVVPPWTRYSPELLEATEIDGVHI